MRYVRFKQILFQNIIEYKWYVMIIFQYSLLDWVDIVMIITYEWFGWTKSWNHSHHLIMMHVHLFECTIK